MSKHFSVPPSQKVAPDQFADDRGLIVASGVCTAQAILDVRSNPCLVSGCLENA